MHCKTGEDTIQELDSLLAASNNCSPNTQTTLLHNNNNNNNNTYVLYGTAALEELWPPYNEDFFIQFNFSYT